MSAYVSLGNLGYSESKCVSVGMGVNSLYMSCTTGVIANFPSYQISAKTEDADYCGSNSTGSCYGSLNSTFKTKLDTCLGNKTCKISGFSSYVSNNTKTCKDEDANIHV